MIRFVAFVAAFAATAAHAAEAVTQFPYDAICMGDDVFVRSGPGQSYYATGKLQKNNRVIVHRHDPGGWFMIAPPAGSISWIESSLVARTGNHGVVTITADSSGRPAQAIVRIGSSLSDDHSLTGRQLTNGDEVAILGERVLQTEAGAVKMLQITPPPREYRWVKGNFIVPLDPALRDQIDNDPYAVPAAHRTPEKFAAMMPPTGAEDSLDAPLLKAPDVPVVAEEIVRTAHQEVTEVPSQRLRLLDIDNAYADMMSLEIRAWRLDELRSQYLSLNANASPALAREIEIRIAALDQRQKLYDRYARFAALAAETDRRDAELLASLPGDPAALPGEVPAVELGAPAEMPTLQPVPQHMAGSEGAMPNAVPVVQQSSGAVAAAAQKMSGAGFVQATTTTQPGVPRHVLTAADGRFLAFLQSSTINLDQYVGQSLGLYGPRAREANLQADLIEVSNVTAVQLAR